MAVLHWAIDMYILISFPDKELIYPCYAELKLNPLVPESVF